MSRSEPMIPGTVSAVLVLVGAGVVLVAGLVAVLAGLETLVGWVLNQA